MIPVPTAYWLLWEHARAGNVTAPEFALAVLISAGLTLCIVWLVDWYIKRP